MVYPKEELEKVSSTHHFPTLGAKSNITILRNYVKNYRNNLLCCFVSQIDDLP